MKKTSFKMLIVLTLILITSCTTQKKIESEDEFAVDADTNVEAIDNLDAKDSGEGTKSAVSDELSLDSTADSNTIAKNDSPSANQDLSLENELNSLSNDPKVSTPEQTPTEQVKSDQPTSELNLDDVGSIVLKTEKPSPADSTKPLTPQPEISAAVVPEPVKPEAAELPAQVSLTPEVSDSVTMKDNSAFSPEKIVTINNVTYQSNDSGGTIAISADQALKYTTRLNSATNQFVIEVENSKIPNKLKRALNTKDMASSIGSVDIYQKAGSNITRFVVQLRAGSSEPMVQPEGNSLLVIGSAVSENTDKGATQITKNAPIESQEKTKDIVQEADMRESTVKGIESEKISQKTKNEIVDLNTEGIMGASDLENFLINNNKYYGKKISIETGSMDIKAFFNFLAEESGINLILDESIAGNVALKLVNVPWDQAFVLVLKAKKLAYRRQGSVLRIGKLEDLISEETAALTLKESRNAQEPTVVKRFFIGYMKLDDLANKIHILMENVGSQLNQDQNQQQMQQGGPQQSPADAAKAAAKAAAAKAQALSMVKVLTDDTTNTIIVSGPEKSVEIVEKFIKALDVQPQQVLIEAKVVEAQESFTKGLGVRWNSTGVSGGTNSTKIGMAPIISTPGVLTTDFTWGSLDILGSLTAQIQLGEREDKVKVLSSPRIVVLSNAKASIEQTSTVNIIQLEQRIDGTRPAVQVQKNYGITLDVTPKISNEGTVMLDFAINRSFLPRSDAEGPDERKAKTMLIVKSGQTAVIGGIFDSQIRQATSGVAWIQDIPILGGLFKSSNEDKTKNELIMFVTPTILKPITGSEKPTDGVF